MKKVHYIKPIHKIPREVTLIVDMVDFRIRNITTDKEENVMTEGVIYEKDITILILMHLIDKLYLK